MKVLNIFLSVLLLFVSCKHKSPELNSINFKSEKISKTASITLNAGIDSVFPLFGAFEERKWSEGWNPTPIYPLTETVEEGTTFKTEGHRHGEREFLWRVSKYNSNQHLIQYLVSSENRCWTITVICSTAADNKTLAQITYTYVGLNKLGNEINKHAIATIYKEDLQDWQDDINYYLSTGATKSH
jgi:hypothetical protein